MTRTGAPSSKELRQLAIRLAAQPSNRPGIDKTRIVLAIESYAKFRALVRQAKRVSQ